MVKYFISALFAATLLTGCVSVPEDATQDPTVITAPYGAKQFCIENPLSELCVESQTNE